MLLRVRAFLKMADKGNVHELFRAEEIVEQTADHHRDGEADKAIELIQPSCVSVRLKLALSSLRIPREWRRSLRSQSKRGSSREIIARG